MEPKKEMSAGTKLIRFYIVEDYHLTRMGLISVLKEYPQLECVGDAESAEDGLAELEGIRPDVLLLDLGLPHMNGIEMAQEVRKRWPDIKVIILTSHNEEEEVVASMGAGAQAYVLKDIAPDRLVNVIETVAEGAVWLDPAIAAMVLNVMSDTSLRRPSGTASSIDLTEREREVLQLVVEGKNNPEIAETLHISVHTAKAHVGSIMAKMSVNDRVQAAIKALRENLV